MSVQIPLWTIVTGVIVYHHKARGYVQIPLWTIVTRPGRKVE